MLGDICPTCKHDSEEQARFIVQNRELRRQRDIALARAAIAEAQIELVNLEDKYAYSRAQTKIQKQKNELNRLYNLQAEAAKNRGEPTKDSTA